MVTTVLKKQSRKNWSKFHDLLEESILKIEKSNNDND